MASPCEIATLWNICFANVKRRISFHIERSEIFHNFRKKIISHSATPNISLNSIVVFLYYEPKKKDRFRTVFFLSNPKDWYGITRRVYGIRRKATAWHHASACIFPSDWFHTSHRDDSIRDYVAIPYKASPWFCELHFCTMSTKRKDTIFRVFSFCFLLLVLHQQYLTNSQVLSRMS